MKLFKTFGLDTANHLLWRNGERVPMAPKAFDVLAYLVEHAGRLVTQDEILEALWSKTYVNPEVLRKYILEIRKTLGDRPGNPEFIETLPKRGYRFVAPVLEESTAEPSVAATSPAMEESAEESTGPTRPPSEEKNPSGKYRRWKFVVLLILAVLAAVAIGGRHFRAARDRAEASSASNTSIVVLPFSDMSAAKDEEYFSDGLSEQLINDLAKIPSLRWLDDPRRFSSRVRTKTCARWDGSLAWLMFLKEVCGATAIMFALPRN